MTLSETYYEAILCILSPAFRVSVPKGQFGQPEQPEHVPPFDPLNMMSAIVLDDDLSQNYNFVTFALKLDIMNGEDPAVTEVTTQLGVLGQTAASASSAY